MYRKCWNTHTCPICGQVFPTKAGYMLHCRNHMKPKENKAVAINTGYFLLRWMILE